MVDLPIELWDCIASQTTLDDLLNLALVSTFLLHVSRRALVRSIHLDAHEKNAYEQMIAFIDKHNLAGLVHELSLKGFDMIEEASALPLGNMTNIKRISIYDCPAFCTATAARNVLIHHIETTYKSLRSIRIHTDTSPLPIQFASIPGLREISWADKPRGILTPALISLLKISRYSLQTLDICIKRDVHHTEDYAQLFSFYFPCLTSLTLGPGHRTLFIDPFPGGEDNGSKQSIRNAFASFLVTHHTLKRLVLPNYSEEWRSLAYLQFAIPAPTAAFLPHLVCLEVHPSLVAELARAGVSLFRSLETLSVQETDNGGTIEDIDDMFMAFRILADDTGQLPLRHLRLAFGEAFPAFHWSDMFSRWVNTSAAVFPLLETWSSTTVPGKNIPNFPHFEHLRTISCMLGCYHVCRSDARTLLARCPALKRLSVRTPYKVFKFIHNDDGLSSPRISIYPPDDNQGAAEGGGDGLLDAIEWSDEEDDGDEY